MFKSITLRQFVCVFSGLQEYLNQQGFHIVGYGCTTCIGNSGDLDESVAAAISDNGTVYFSGMIASPPVTYILSLCLKIRLTPDHFYHRYCCRCCSIWK